MIPLQEISTDFCFQFPGNVVVYFKFHSVCVVVIVVVVFVYFICTMYIVGLSQSDEGPATLHLRCPSDRNDNSSGQTSADVITDPCRHIGTRHNRR